MSDLGNRMYEAFWTATRTLGDDETVHDMDKPYFDEDMEMIDCSGCGMPSKFWEHMAAAFTRQEDVGRGFHGVSDTNNKEQQ